MIEQEDSDGHKVVGPKLQAINRFHDMDKLKNYEVIRKLGQGTFGVVQKAKNLRTNEMVALKQLINHSAKEGFPITAMREITILKKLHHENVLEIINLIYEEPKVTNPQDLIHQRGCFYTVSHYMYSDLVGLLENPNVKIEVPHIKCFMTQLLQGVQYIHDNMLLHRDIKAANILIDKNGVLKIADFGLARQYHGKAPALNGGPGGGERSYTALVVTRWYRPPEIFLGERKYTTAVDMWGVGCVFGEMFTQKPILVGKTDAHQAQLIFSLVGPPNAVNWPYANNLPNKNDLNIGLTCQRTLESRFGPLLGPEGVDLLSGLLTLDPYKRLNALDALNHRYFRTDPLPAQAHELPHIEECHEIDKERFKLQKEKEGKLPRDDHRDKSFGDGRQDPAALTGNRPPKPMSKGLAIPTGPRHQPKPYGYRQHNNYSSWNQGNRVSKPAYRGPDNEPAPKPDSQVSEPSTVSTYESLRERSPGRTNRGSTTTGPSNFNEKKNETTQRDEGANSAKRSLSNSSQTNNFKQATKTVFAPTHATNAPQTKHGDQANPPLNKMSLLATRPAASKVSGVFMPKSKVAPSARMANGGRAPDRVKRRKLFNDDQNDSDLTDFDEDVKESNQFDNFLDWDTYSRSSDYRKLQFEKRNFETRK